MATTTFSFAGLAWWQWGKIAGLFVPMTLVTNQIDNPVLWAIAIHLFVDFTCQSNQTAAGKAQGKVWVLAYHSLISGGLPAFVVCGFWLPGLIVGIAVHYLVDSTNKFGRADDLGWILDQSAHILTIVILAIIF